MDGFIYIMSNPAMGNRIKIGKSSRDPKSFREKELSDTAIPEPFKVEFSAFVEEYDEIEKQIHVYFDHFRPNKQREFFTCKISEAIAFIESISVVKFKENFHKSSKEIEIEKKKLEMINLQNKQTKEFGEYTEKAKEKFNNIQLERIQKEIKENSVNVYTWIDSIPNLLGLSLISIILYMFLDSFLFNPYKGIPNWWIVPAACFTGWIINNHLKNKKIDELTQQKIKEYPLKTSSESFGVDFFKERPIYCVFNFKTGKKYYYSDDYIDDKFFGMVYLPEVRDSVIRVKTIRDAEELGFVRAPKHNYHMELELMINENNK